MLRNGRASSLRELGAVQPGFAVHVGGDEEVACERAGGAGRDGHVSPPDKLEYPEGVRGRLVECLVAGDRRDAEELELGARERKQKRDRVIVPRVAVEQDRRAHGTTCS